MTLPSFVRHLTVLEEARLVRSTKEGRVRTVALAPEQIEEAVDWLSRQRRVWEARLDRFDQYAKSLKSREEETP